MNRNNSSQSFSILIVTALFLVGWLLFFPPKKTPDTPATQTNAPTAVYTNETGTPVNEMVYYLKNDLKLESRTAPSNIILVFGQNQHMEIDTVGGSIAEHSINGKWNALKTPVSMIPSDSKVSPGDFFFGSLETLKDYPVRPVYTIASQTENSAVLTARIMYKGQPLDISRTYTLISNYQFIQTVSVSNASKTPLKIDVGGKSFTFASTYAFSGPTNANAGNILKVSSFNGKKVTDPTSQGLLGFFKPKIVNTTVSDPRWFALHDNFFAAYIQPDFNTLGRIMLEKQTNMYSEYAVGYELPPLFLEGNETKSWTIRSYVGPKRESIVGKIDPSYKKLFSWPAVFYWFMKPLELGMIWLMDFLSKFITNWGLLFIVLAILIKVILSPLSINAAMSIKRTNLLQPKMKALQEKYKDDPNTLNQKMGELYKKEGINPLGGCLPVLLQLPVFFALLRVLYGLVEIRGVSFLWIKDLTQPDALFMINLPFFHGAFNLLPIIMTVIQFVQVQLQTMKTGAASDQQKLNSFILPLILLFVFWGMPAGLVIYWTVQNLYSIAEQEFVNLDKKLALKKKA